MTPLETELLTVARSYLGERETDGPNDSPQIREFLKYVGIGKPSAYCAAFASFCIHEASGRVPCTPKFKRSAGALNLKKVNPDLVITAEEALERLREGRPCVFGFPVGDKGLGHVGIAYGLSDDETRIHTIEGNTGPGPAVAAKDRDGDGVHERSDRKFVSAKFWLMVE